MNVLALGTSWESILVVVGFLLLSAISNWIKQRRQGADPDPWTERDARSHPSSQQDKTAPPHIPRASTPAPKQFRWEEELRKLLEGDEAEQTLPPPLPLAPPRPAVQAPRPALVPPAGLPAPPALQPTITEDSPSLESMTRDIQLARMTESKQAYQHGQDLAQQVAERLHQVDAQIVRHAVPEHKTVRHETVQAIKTLREPQSARQAFVASLVFGAPKAFEDS